MTLSIQHATQFKPDYQKILAAVQASSSAIGSHNAAWPLIQAWIKKFHDSDIQFDILAVEPEMSAWLDDATLLVGRVDLLCSDFFGEWKTAKVKRSNWAAQWQMSPQALTYALLTRHGNIYGNDTNITMPKLNRFLVRNVYKTTPPTCDFEWLRYKDAEIDYWRQTVIRIASRIRNSRLNDGVPWLTNFDHCFKYGEKYACPYYAKCSKLNFTGSGGANQIMYEIREPHLAIERDMRLGVADVSAAQVGTFNGDAQNLVILDATRIETYLNCEERYRNEYEDNLRLPTNEALLTGTAFHSGVAEYYRQLMQVK